MLYSFLTLAKSCHDSLSLLAKNEFKQQSKLLCFVKGFCAFVSYFLRNHATDLLTEVWIAFCLEDRCGQYRLWKGCWRPRRFFAIEPRACLIQCVGRLLFGFLNLPRSIALVHGTIKLLILKDTFELANQRTERGIQSIGTWTRHCRESPQNLLSLKLFDFAFLR